MFYVRTKEIKRFSLERVSLDGELAGRHTTLSTYLNLINNGSNKSVLKISKEKKNTHKVCYDEG